MEFITIFRRLDEEAKAILPKNKVNWIFRQEPLQAKKESDRDYIVVSPLLKEDERFKRETLEEIADLFRSEGRPLRISKPSYFGPITLGNIPYYGTLSTFPPIPSYDDEPWRGCRQIEMRFDSLDDPALLKALDILKAYLPSEVSKDARAEVDYLHVAKMT